MALRIFTATCRPLLAALHKWLYRGVLDDPAEEFFVQASGAWGGVGEGQAGLAWHAATLPSGAAALPSWAAERCSC